MFFTMRLTKVTKVDYPNYNTMPQDYGYYADRGRTKGEGRLGYPLKYYSHALVIRAKLLTLSSEKLDRRSSSTSAHKGKRGLLKVA